MEIGWISGVHAFRAAVARAGRIHATAPGAEPGLDSKSSARFGPGSAPGAGAADGSAGRIHAVDAHSFRPGPHVAPARDCTDPARCSAREFTGCPSAAGAQRGFGCTAGASAGGATAAGHVGTG